jgi:hypothetical protein
VELPDCLGGGLVVLAFACSLFVTVGPFGASTAVATTTTITVPYDGLTGVEGAPQFWKVPPKVYSVTFRVFGAQGGKSPGSPFTTAVGGRGGEVTATLAVKPGELLEVNVGGMPGKLLGLFGSSGFNGGGRGGGRPPFSGGGGGGASDVRRSPFALTDRLLVAGGGGGAGSPGSGGATFSTGPTDGGAGGGESGGAGSSLGVQSCGYNQNGNNGPTAYLGPFGGDGGGSTRGGGGGVTCGAFPAAGSQGSGGRGASGEVVMCSAGSYYSGSGGGGGGGYYGGGGGGAGNLLWSDLTDALCNGDGGAGGGGGSGFGPPGAVFRPGARGGSGLVTVTYTPNCSHGALCVRSVPGAPTNVEAAAGNHKATVAFATPTTTVPTTFEVTASPGGKTATSSSDPIIVGGLKNGTKYTFTVTAANELGTGKRSRRSNQVTPAPPPGAPTSVMAVALDHQAIVSFTAPKSRWSPIVAYKVIVSRTPGPELDAGSPFTAHNVIPSPAPGGGVVSVRPVTVVQGSGQPVKSPITFTGLTDGVTYTFTVTATNGIGTGPRSIPSNPVTPVGAPNAPTGVIASAGNAQATIAFNRPYANGSPITSYTVTALPGGATATGKRSPITLTGLTNGTSYTFTVTATNAIGTSPASKPSNVITPAGGFAVTVRLVGGSRSQRR